MTLLSRLDVNYIAIASTILNMIPQLCPKETCEIDTFSPRPKKGQEHRGKEIQLLCFRLSSGCMVVSYLGSLLLNLRLYFLLRHEKEIVFLQCIVNSEIRKKLWTELPASPPQKRVLTDVLFCPNELRAIILHSLSDELDSRKQKTFGTHFPRCSRIAY